MLLSFVFRARHSDLKVLVKHIDVALVINLYLVRLRLLGTGRKLRSIHFEQVHRSDSMRHVLVIYDRLQVQFVE